jgi:hypothetical protein
VDKNAEELYDVAIKSNDILYKASTVFPFTLFPDTITIDREKVTLAHRYFFSVVELHTIRIDDVLSAESTIGPFFGTIKITSKYFVKEPRVISYLHRDDTEKLQRLLHGYTIARKREIDCTHIPVNELTSMLMELGHESTG